MQVAHILRKYNPAEWGGTETAVKQLLDGLRDEGVEGTVYCPKLRQPSARDPFADAGHKLGRYSAFVPVFNLTEEQREQLIATTRASDQVAQAFLQEGAVRQVGQRVVMRKMM